MKTIGLIGGMSWESSLEYYRMINEKTKQALGGYASSKSLMYTVDFSEIEPLQRTGDWAALDRKMAEAALQLQSGGAELILLCTNTMHLSAQAIEKAIDVPFLHIAEATGQAIQQRTMKKVGLIGTKFTMEKDFYKSTLKEKFSVDTIIPDAGDRDELHRIIYDELVNGKFLESSKKKCLEIIERLVAKGAEGIVLGCTEIPLIISQEDVAIPVFNTMALHAQEAVDWAIQGEEAVA
ncbi:MAG: aspartate/glutamate racemase family protein [Saprospiraceae bacterium]|nr:aspartate/glutamate racemase family protein [Saprospiraceae bacterium]